MTPEIDAIVIGAGVVGLAVARRLAMAGQEVIVLEAAKAIGTGTSSRNSEVIHAGIYYPQKSLKAALCVAGRDQLYSYCARRGIAHRRIGKLIVATRDNELATLGSIAQAARRNGVDDLVELDRAQVARLEPALDACGALLSPSTGIIDTHGLMLSLQGEAEEHGAVIALNAPVLSGRMLGNGVALRVGGAVAHTIISRVVVNAAGLAAAEVAGRIEGLQAPVPKITFAKGNYFGLTGKAPFSRLIYPVPEEGGLGVHLTMDLAGRARFGPDVEWIETLDYSVDARRAAPFYGAIRSYWPGLPNGALFPDYCGIRPKVLAGEGADFVIEGAGGRFTSLFGIESPGLTSSLAIADKIVNGMSDMLSCGCNV